MRRVRRLLVVAALVAVAAGVSGAIVASRPAGDQRGTAADESGVGAAAVPGTEARPDLPIPIGTLRSTSYEEGEARQESAHTQVTHALGTTNEAARRGERAGFANLRRGDPESNGGRRAEWHSGISAEPGDEMSYAISFWIPDDWDAYGETTTSSQDKRIIFQIHGGISDWSPLFGIQIYDEDGEHRVGFYRKESRRGPDTVLWSQSLVLEEWVDFAYETLWTQDKDGYIRFYRNGELVYEANDIATLPSDATPYAKWGIYGQPARILFDEVRISRGPLVWESD